MEFKDVLLKKEEGIATITINRPHRRNSINEEVLGELIAAFDDVARDDEVRVVILTGAGAAFSVGADISSGEEGERVMQETDAEAIRRWERQAQRLVWGIYELEKPTIAMVNGVAAGGGFDFALACDIRIGSENARFRSFTQIAHIPADGGVWTMDRIMGPARAAEMLFTADIVNARDAERMGILNKVVPQEELEAETMALARRIAQQAPISLRLNKVMLRKAAQMDFHSMLEVASLCAPICILSQDFQEARKAFQEKRQPTFHGR